MFFTKKSFVYLSFANGKHEASTSHIALILCFDFGCLRVCMYVCMNLFDFVLCKQDTLTNNGIKFHKGQFMSCFGNIFSSCVKVSCTSGTQEFDGDGFALSSGHG